MWWKILYEVEEKALNVRRGDIKSLHLSMTMALLISLRVSSCHVNVISSNRFTGWAGR